MIFSFMSLDQNAFIIFPVIWRQSFVSCINHERFPGYPAVFRTVIYSRGIEKADSDYG